MQTQGKIKLIKETETFGANGFKKRELVIVTDEKFPQHLPIEFTQDKCELLDKFAVGQTVKIDINLQGREWINPQGEAKYFPSFGGWRIEAVGAVNTPQPDEFNPNAGDDDVDF